MICRKCNGRMLGAGEEAACINCGYRGGPLPAAAPRPPARGIASARRRRPAAVPAGRPHEKIAR